MYVTAGKLHTNEGMCERGKKCPIIINKEMYSEFLFTTCLMVSTKGRKLPFLSSRTLQDLQSLNTSIKCEMSYWLF